MEHDTSNLPSLLEPWFKALATRHYLNFGLNFKDVLTHRIPPGGVFWIDTGVKEAPSEVLDAMELFALLARADLALWKKQLKKWCHGTTSRTVELLDDLFPATVGFRVHLQREHESVATFTVQDRRPGMEPADFRHARSILLSMVRAHGLHIDEVPVQVDWSASYLSAASSALLQAALMQQQYQQSSTRKYKGLRIRSALISSRHGRLPDLAHLLNLAGVVECGITIESSEVVPPSHEHPAEFVKAMQTVFATVSGDTGIQRAEITRLPDRRAFASIYSALHASKSVSSVVINPCLSCVGRDDRPRLWSWIAWALFRRDPRRARRVLDLALNVKCLRAADIDAMKAILEAPDPLVPLVARDVSVQTKTISAQRFTLLDPTKRDKNQSHGKVYVTGQSQGELPVLDRNGQWWSVLLPGWGSAWVHQDDILAHETEESRKSTVQWIPQLALVEMTFGSCNAALSLIELVGTSLWRLRIENYISQDGEYPLDDWLRRVLEVCPRLECLELRTVYLDSLQVLHDAFASQKCRLRRLVLIDVPVADLKVSLESLFSTLGDSSHPLARSLDELVCHMNLADVAVPTVTKMLERNTKLRLLDIETTGSSRLPRAVSGPITAFDQQTLTYRDRRLQLAFLSAITSRDNRGDEQVAARGKLDSSVLELIFEFAAGTTTRTVVVEPKST